MTDAYLNRIATAVPPHDIHRRFVDYAPSFLREAKERRLFARMAARCGIEHRYSVLPLDAEPQRLAAFYPAAAFPGTAVRMARYRAEALPLAVEACDRLGVTGRRADITHLIVTSCTGFYAPGLDLDIIRHYGLSPAVERSLIGFMGCYAAVNALKFARHIVRSEPLALVLVVNLELCTLHLQSGPGIEALLSFLLFADGAAASFVSAEPAGLRLDRFASGILPDSDRHITWDVGDQGFDMILSGQVPNAIAGTLPEVFPHLCGGAADHVAHWAIHPGGRSVLDAVEAALRLPAEALAGSREVLARYGNMSSATLMFVLQALLEGDAPAGPGLALAFGPGVMVEAMRFFKRAPS